MTSTRASGILLHPTSLPGPFGIGDLGPEAYRFIDFLHAAGQRIWQVLPLGPTGYADSPYQCFSAFAGNPLLLSPELLAQRGWLTEQDLNTAPRFPEGEVDYGSVIAWKSPLLERAAEAFASSQSKEEYLRFCEEQAGWLDDYALFMACKESHNLVAWNHWEPSIRDRDQPTLHTHRALLAPGVERHKFLQYEFFRQWGLLKAYCHERGIRIMGDVPIYVAHDSADVWSHPELFQLEPDGRPTVVAGVPPDYFSATGQLWGNPIYRWDVQKASGFTWWTERLRATLLQFDIIRIDHFRGFQAYWEVPGGEATAQNGRWVLGPGADLFEAAEEVLGKLPIVAENLGVITPEVEAIRERFGFPGMAILQFAFGKDPQAPDFKPHNYPRQRLAYTGTHDNDTTVGWWRSTGEGDSTRTPAEVQAEKDYARRYLNTDGSDIQWAFIRALMASVADTVLIPMQDVLGLGTEARMNQPATVGKNWRWRMRHRASVEHQDRLREMAATYERI